MTGMGLDEFLGYDTRASSGAKYLRGWKKRTPPLVDVWLHTGAKIVALWQHGFQRLVPREDKQSGRQWLEVWSNPVNCIESEDVLRKQYKRTEDDERMVEPVVCPMCRLVETVRCKVRDGELELLTPVFSFGATDPSKSRVLHAGGLYNAFSDDRLSEEVKRDMYKAGISQKTAWQENGYARCMYVFSVVDESAPEKGVQVAIETTLVGDKVKECIRDEMTRKGEDEGNPLKHPYAIRWEHKPNELEFGKKYKAIAMDRISLTPRVRELIYSADPPDLSRLVALPNMKTLRATLERHALVSLPWDDIFGPAEKAGLSGPDDEEEEEEESGAQVAPTPVEQKEPPAAIVVTPELAAAVVATHPEPVKEQPKAGRQVKSKPIEMVPCDVCKKPMPATATKCEACGVEYEFEADATPVAVAAPVQAPAPPPVPVVVPPPPTTKGKGKKQQQVEGAGVVDNDLDDLPF